MKIKFETIDKNKWKVEKEETVKIYGIIYCENYLQIVEIRIED